LQTGDVIESINGENFTNAADLLQRLSAADGQPVTLGVIRNDEAASVTLTPELASDQAVVDTHPIVLDVSDGTPAASAGLQSGDLIMAFNGEPLADYETLQQMTAQHLDELVMLTIWRSGETLDVTLTPRSNPPEGQGSMGVGISTAAINPALGIAFQEGQKSDLRPLQLGEAMQYSLNRISDVLNTIASIPGQILGGTADSNSLRLTSPLGISQAGGIFLQESIERNQPGIILEFMALISLALGLTNLLPIPALDGGRILFVLIEIVRGRPIAPEREGMVHLVGLALLLSLMVVVLLNDIANPLTNLLR
jgi:regulator of sigma E protease